MACANRAGRFMTGRSVEPDGPRVFKLRQTIKAQGDSPGPSDIEWPVRAQVRRASLLELNSSLDGLGHLLLRRSNDTLELLVGGLGL